MYQIFADRFRDGDPANNTPAGEFFYEETPTVVRSNDVSSRWNTIICDPRDATSDCPSVYSQNFYGGDLQGVVDKLDYLQDLGVTVIYFNPIFESPSNHKYDTTDFSVIDDNMSVCVSMKYLCDYTIQNTMTLYYCTESFYVSHEIYSSEVRRITRMNSN